MEYELQYLMARQNHGIWTSNSTFCSFNVSRSLLKQKPGYFYYLKVFGANTYDFLSKLFM